MKTVVHIALVLGTASLEAQQPDSASLGPPPGRLVEVGGRRLHLLCSGTGSPTVLLEAGASSFAIDWTLVQEELARTNRVCSYDRAGSGWSQGTGQSAAKIVGDLHELIQQAGEPGPYVLVGASIGGVYVRLYQAEYPDAVAGLVLVDPASEDRLFTMFKGQAVEIASLTAEELRTLLPTGPVAVPKRKPQTGAPFDRLPPALYQLRIKLDQKLIAAIPDSVSAELVGRIREAERAGLARLRDLRLRAEHPLGDLPLIVLTRGTDQGNGLVRSHQGLAALSTNGRQRIAEGAGHEIHLFTPIQVIRAIREVAQAAATHGKLPQSP